MLPFKRFNPAVFLGGIFGFLSIALGAYTDHALKKTLAPHDLESLSTALRYLSLHALVMITIGLTQFTITQPKIKQRLLLSTVFFSVGVTLFSGGIFAATALGFEAALTCVPFGGTLLMIAWLILASVGLIKNSQSTQ